MTTVETPLQDLSPSFAQRMLVWVWNLINAVIGGMAAAGSGVGVGMMTGAATFTQRQFWAMAIGAGVVAGFAYVRSNRLPEIFLTAESRNRLSTMDGGR